MSGLTTRRRSFAAMQLAASSPGMRAEPRIDHPDLVLGPILRQPLSRLLGQPLPYFERA